MHCGLQKAMERGALGFPTTRSSTLINPEKLSKQPEPPLMAEFQCRGCEKKSSAIRISIIDINWYICL
jgi:hypothetical protein